MFLLQVLPLSSPDRDTVYRVSSLSKILTPNGSLFKGQDVWEPIWKGASIFKCKIYEDTYCKHC